MTARTAASLGAPGRSRILGTVTNVLLWLMVGVDVLFVIGLLSAAGNTPLVGVWLSLATQWIPVTIFWLVARATGFTQLPVILAAAAVTVSALGDTYYALAMDTDGFLAFPSPADAAYLLFYPLMVGALVVLVRRQLGGVRGLVLLETAVATVGASAVLAVILDPVIRGALAGESAINSAISLAYPVFDLILLAVMAGITSVATVTLGRRSWALIAGLGVFTAADIVYALLVHQGSYLSGTPLDATWAVGLGLITWWVAGMSRSRAEDVPAARRRSLIPLPAVAVVAGLAVLILGTQVHLSLFAVILAALTVGLGAVPIIFRQAVLGRMLASQEEAVRRLTELDQHKTDILMTMNHEFRTPLTTINAHVELLLDGVAGEMPPEAIKILSTIERNGARLQGLIEETLTLSTLEHGQDRSVHSPLDVAVLVTHSVARVEDFAQTRGVELTVGVVNSGLLIDADAMHLERALANLIDNAVKFSAAGGKVTVSADGSTVPGEVAIRVTDHGIGIPTADIRHLFRRFFRASNVQNAAIPGVGLGLSITQQVVRAHGGTIAVDSAVGHGTTITVRLPLIPSGATKPGRRIRS